MPVTKKPHIDNWEEYNTKDGPVNLPPALVRILCNETMFKPVPHDEFKHQLDNVQVSCQVTLPSLGQEPRHYGEGY